jgi:hypothetical protein
MDPLSAAAAALRAPGAADTYTTEAAALSTVASLPPGVTISSAADPSYTAQPPLPPWPAPAPLLPMPAHAQ